MQEISTDIFTFEILRERNALYIDKTGYVARMVASSSTSYFLSRPRRFGKSLLLSTIKAYFQGKRNLFRGLQIDKAISDDWEQYPVIHLDLARGSSLEGIEKIREKMSSEVYYAGRELGIEIEKESPDQMLKVLINQAYEKYGKRVVILIDEYDKPILDSAFQPYQQETVRMMSTFFQELKSANEKERFVFITGVTKFAHVSLFSGSNNPTDISRKAEYSSIVGYTEEELRSSFKEYIDIVSEQFGYEQERLLSKIKLWYNGMRFLANTESVYNPVSIGNFFNNQRFDNYWISTGTTRMLVDKVKNTPFKLQDFAINWVPDKESDKYDIENVSVEDLAIQTGYLTIAEWRNAGDEMNEVRYDFPNKEIRDVWYSNIVGLTTNYTASEYEPLIIKMRDALNENDVELFMTIVERFFSGIPYENAGEIGEGYFRNQLRTLFCLFGIPNQCEVQQASMRTDIVAQTRRLAVVFEVKCVEERDDESAVKRLLSEATKQIIDKHYTDRYRNESDEVHAVSIVFNKKTRMLVAWELAE
ncbi:MAG: AAA family ATPase [Marinilabiliaceae bacterium]|nr:AAA family ATPase [Marinilabiliaceae bacterium]